MPGAPPGVPEAANLTPSGPLRGWSEDDFATFVRRGVRPNGSAVDSIMPWRALGRLSPDERRGLLLYLRSLPSARSTRS
jgi:hypothetical protein